MAVKRPQGHKHAQRESLLLKTLSSFFLQITQDNERLNALSVTRLKLSPDGGICSLYIHAAGGIKEFEELRSELVLYKPSLRAALAKAVHLRRIPDIRFIYDEVFDEQQRVSELIEDLKERGKL